MGKAWKYMYLLQITYIYVRLYVKLDQDDGCRKKFWSWKRHENWCPWKCRKPEILPFSKNFGLICEPDLIFPAVFLPHRTLLVRHRRSHHQRDWERHPLQQKVPPGSWLDLRKTDLLEYRNRYGQTWKKQEQNWLYDLHLVIASFDHALVKGRYKGLIAFLQGLSLWRRQPSSITCITAISRSDFGCYFAQLTEPLLWLLCCHTYVPNCPLFHNSVCYDLILSKPWNLTCSS